MSRPPKKPEPPFMKDGVQTRVPNGPRSGRENTQPSGRVQPEGGGSGAGVWGQSTWGDPTDNVVNSQGYPGPGPTPSQNAAAGITGVSALASAGTVPTVEHRSLTAEPSHFSINMGESLSARDASVNVTLENFKSKARAKTRFPRQVVIRNKQQATVQSRILIATLQEALDFRPVPGDNRTQPELRQHLNLSEPAAHALFSELLVELKKINAFLENSPKNAKIEKKTVGKLEKVGLQVLTTYGKTIAVGAGLLTLGALCTLLNALGAEHVVDNAMIWKRFGK